MRKEQFLKVLVLMGDNTTKEVIVTEDYFNQGYGLPAGKIKVLNKELVILPVYELNDRVTVDVHRGSIENEDGISTGGQWYIKSGIITDVYSTLFNNGFVEFDDGGCQSVSLIHGNNGFPGKNIRAEEK